MSVENHENGGGELAAIERWPDALGELHTRVTERFRRPEVKERAKRYLAGLLGRVQRRRWCRMDLDSFPVSLYVLVDDWWQEHHPSSVRNSISHP